MEGARIFFRIPIFGGLPVTETMVNSWILIAAITLLCIFLTRKLKLKEITKRQAIAEWAVQAVNNLVEESMGKAHVKTYAPYIGALFSFSLFGSLSSLLGMKPITSDINTTLGWAVVTFVMIQYSKIKYHGIKQFFKGFTEPIFVMTPLNIISEFATPLSLGFRHFGNIAAGTVITSLLYSALAYLSSVILGGIQIPFMQIGLPAILSIYFDLFTSALQAFIFCMLTMAYVSSAIDD